MSTPPTASAGGQPQPLSGKLFIGLTGGIGSGKSTVATLFGELGVPVIDSDVISHELTQTGGGAIAEIRAAFGPEFLDENGALNRGKMRELVFSTPDAKQRLESILHPKIRAQMLAEVLTTGPAPYVLLVIPLLFEAPNYRELVQRTLVVDCPETTQIARTMSRSGLDEQAVRTIMARQLAREQRLGLADDVIHNDGTLDQLRPQVARLHQLYSRLSSGVTPRPSGGD